MKTIGKFVAGIRQKMFAARVNREIFQEIFPHMRGDADRGYSFHSDDEIVRANIRGRLQTKLDLDLIDRAAARMPEAYGRAFRHIFYRDLQKRMEMYMEIAEERIQPETCDPRFVATRA